jgi:hypothetical protein
MVRPDHTLVANRTTESLALFPLATLRKGSGAKLFKLSLLTMLVQSVVVATSVKGLLIPYLLILAQGAKDLFLSMVSRPRLQVWTPFLGFVAAFVFFVGLSQLLNVIMTPRFDHLILVSPESASVSFLRSSLFTQGLYLATCVLFFLYLYEYLKAADSVEPVMRLMRAGLVFFVAFGFYEFAGYLITGTNVDFISNRITGDDRTYSTFQTLNLGGLIVPRMKSLAGEASMFAFSLVPFVALFYYLKDRLWIVLLVAVLLSTSTTAYLGLACLVLIESLLAGRPGRLLIGLGFFFGLIWLIAPDTVAGLVQFGMEKFRLENQSGIDRMTNFRDTWAFFASSDPLHMLFGYGFGYVRSTDGFTTLLVNVGVGGLVLFVGFLLYPVLKLQGSTDYHRGLLAAMLVTVVMIMVSVPEFYYLQIWFLSGLAWFAYRRKRGGLALATAALERQG